MGRSYDAVVPAGGSARRLGGADKPGVQVAGRSLLDRVLEACADAGRTIVVGPARPTTRPVTWARESPIGGGPAAALQAGLMWCRAEQVGVFAADLPFLDVASVRELRAACVERDGAVMVDTSGRTQWLAAVYQRRSLQAALDGVGGEVAGMPLRMLLGDLDLAAVPGRAYAALDCDTWEDVATARRLADPPVPPEAGDDMFEKWLREAAAELGRPELALSQAQQAEVLELARVAAHSIARPAAPLTTFLAGYALGASGDLSGLADVVARLSTHAESHEGPA